MEVSIPVFYRLASISCYLPSVLNSRQLGNVFEAKLLLKDTLNIKAIAGVPGEKPEVMSDKLPDSPSKFPCIHL